MIPHHVNDGFPDGATEDGIRPSLQRDPTAQRKVKAEDSLSMCHSFIARQPTNATHKL